MEIEHEILQLLNISIKDKASDLYLSSGAPPILRIDGDLVPISNQKIIDAKTAQKLIFSLMDEKQKESFNETHDLDFAFQLSDGTAFRVNVYHQLNGISGVFRLIPQRIPLLEEIGLPEHIKDLLNLSSGLILVTGPTGCGKSTTLASMINYINTTKACHIITVEDPIEFFYKNKKCLIDQRQVFRDTLSFDAALRASLREAPDVILVGEMRDLETIRLALTAAETGHLVMATLHTSSAPHAISRIVDVFPPGEKNIIRNLVSESLRAVICQVLLKRVHAGRVAAFEIMLGIPAIRNLIREDKIGQMYSVIQTSAQNGMCTMENSFKELITKKIISRNAIYESGFQRELFEHF